MLAESPIDLPNVHVAISIPRQHLSECIHAIKSGRIIGKRIKAPDGVPPERNGIETRKTGDLAGRAACWRAYLSLDYSWNIKICLL